jgi:hypothetical protein
MENIIHLHLVGEGQNEKLTSQSIGKVKD